MQRKNLDEIIENTKASFIPGFKNKEKPNVYDAKFLSDAQSIPNTNFIASAGPKEPTLKNFIQDLFTNSIKEVVALGDCLAYANHDHQDFIDYCLQEREITLDKFKVKVTHLEGETVTTESGHQIFPKKELVRSQLSISDGLETKEVNVTLFKLHDNDYLNLKAKPKLQYGSETESETESDSDSEKKFTPKAKLTPIEEIILTIHEKSKKEQVLVHCAGGVGRTGFFILTNLILQKYDDIFGADSISLSIQKIEALLEKMRSVRPCLVNTIDQYEYAIRGANALYQYRQCLEPVKTAKTENKTTISALNLFSSVSSKETHSSLNQNREELSQSEPRIRRSFSSPQLRK